MPIELTSFGSSLLVILGIILGNFLLAWLMSLIARRLARAILALSRVAPPRARPTPERQRTLEGLLGSLITFVAFLVAMGATLSLFVKPETLVWIIGLFSAAFGLGARALVGNLLAGAGFIFKNTFTIGEKVELFVGMTPVEGIVEEVNLTNTLVRAPTGELYLAPNGDIGVVRNFSRAAYSPIKVKLAVPAADLLRTVELLEALAPKAVEALPDLTEPWQVISTSDQIGAKVEITVLAHASFARAAWLKLRVLDLIYRRLAEAGIHLTD
jgi:small conductance mechanosensitive channel